jgi:SynChlorMet cassette protein ScmC
MIKKGFYYLQLSDGIVLELIQTSDDTCDVIYRFAKVMNMTKVKPDSNSTAIENKVYSIDFFEEIYSKYHNYQLLSRNNAYKFLFNANFTKGMSFINSIRKADKSLNFSSIDNIQIGLQIQMIMNLNATPCHCALVEINGKGAIIGAVGNSGKSTCAARLPAPHKVLCDDYAMLFFHDGKITAQAMPTWSNFINGNRDYQADCSRSTEVEAFFILKQSDSDYVVSINGINAYQHINMIFQDLLSIRLLKEKPEGFSEFIRTKVFDLAREAVTTTPTYMLYATLEGDFWNKMAEVMG